MAILTCQCGNHGYDHRPRILSCQHQAKDMEYAGLVREKSRYTGGRTWAPQQLTDHVRTRIMLVLVQGYSMEEEQKWQSIGIPDRLGYSTRRHDHTQNWLNSNQDKEVCI